MLSKSERREKEKLWLWWGFCVLLTNNEYLKMKKIRHIFIPFFSIEKSLNSLCIKFRSAKVSLFGEKIIFSKQNYLFVLLLMSVEFRECERIFVEKKECWMLTVSEMWCEIKLGGIFFIRILISRWFFFHTHLTSRRYFDFDAEK